MEHHFGSYQADVAAYRVDETAREVVEERNPLDDIVAAEVAYVATLRRYFAALRRATRRHVERPLASIVGKGGGKRRLAVAMARVRAELAEEYPPQELDALAREQAARVAEVSRRRYTSTLNKQLEAAKKAGDKEHVARIENALASGTTANLKAAEEFLVREQRAKLRRVTARHNAKVAKDVGDVIAGAGALLMIARKKRKKPAEVRKDDPAVLARVRSSMGVRAREVGRSADVFALGIVNGLVKEQDAARMRAAGMDEYTWRTMRDVLVRPSHRAREGKRYKRSNPPAGGHPGEDWLCRCYAEPIAE